MRARFSLHWIRLLRLMILLACLPFGSAAALASPPGDLGAPVEPAVRDEIASAGQATFWVVIDEQADLAPASAMRDWNARGRFVYEALHDVARKSQAGLVNSLKAQGAPFEPFWIVNAVRVRGGAQALNAAAMQPGVREIVADRTYPIPDFGPGAEEAAVAGIEWNISRIQADQVWSNYGVRGEGIVVATIDTGVQFDHPALVAQYRGNLGGGSFDHNYSWYDPARICGNPSLAPCDNSGHGTHVTGTLVGSDGGTNQIGVAPAARWISAKGCESTTAGCSLASLLAAGQWVLAPTDLNGANPSSALRPHIVNGSWNAAPGDTFFRGTVQAWLASGIFPAFSAGNGGPACSTSTPPGDYPEAYATGAFDSSNGIWINSARGSPNSAVVKPNIAAPGVNVRSSWPPSTYATDTGTSMASPHVAGTVALMWSAASVLIGDIATTRALLDQSAVDVEDLSCSGTPGNNNLWGQGRLDALAAVRLARQKQCADSFGYTCEEVAPSYLDAVDVLPLPGAGDDRVAPLDLPFPFCFYGQRQKIAYICENGYVSFLPPTGQSCPYANTGLPNPPQPNLAVYAFWDDLVVDPAANASLRTALLHTTTSRQFVIEWHNVYQRSEPSVLFDFELVLDESGIILTQYRNIGSGALQRGSSATLGIEDASGTVGIQFSYKQPIIAHSPFAIRYSSAVPCRVAFVPIILR